MVQPSAAACAGLACGVALGVLACQQLRPRRPRRIFIMRHGPKETNTADRDNFQLMLLPEAHDALRELHAFLEAHAVTFSAVLSSPYRRCRETAAAVAPSSMPVIEPGLSEVLGVKHGLRDGRGGAGSLHSTRDRIQELVQGQRSGPIISPQELEIDEDGTFMACMKRSCKLVEQLSSRYPQGDLLLVGHGGSCFGVINACLHAVAVPFEGKGCPDMGSITVLEEVT